MYLFKDMNLPKRAKANKAFTIPELLTIIAVISILVAVVWVMVSDTGNAQARDAKRVSEVNTLRAALKLYHMDHGKYPEQEGTWCSIETDCTTLVQELLDGGYLTDIPEDPLFGKGMEEAGQLFSYQYISTSSGQGYTVYSDLETREPYEISGGGYITTPPPPPPPGPPTVITNSATAIGDNDAMLHGKITNIGSGNAVERGFEWGTSPGNYTTGWWIESGDFGVEDFSNTENSFNLCTNYYYRAKAQNTDGWGYGNEMSFKTTGCAASPLICALRTDCQAGETALFHLYQGTNSHVDDDTGAYKICCEDILSVSYPMTSCGAGEAVISMFSISLPGGSHAADPNSYEYLVCAESTSGTLQCMVQSGSSCSGDFGKVVGLYALTNSHAEGPSYTNYNYSVCCQIAP